MDTPNTVPEVTPEQMLQKSGGVETTPVAEVVSNIPSQTTQQPNDDIKSKKALTDIQTKLSKTVTKEELADLTSSDVEPADVDWTNRVRDIIKKDEGKPYKEEEDAEALNEAYMKSRFNVDIDEPVEEK
jgi:hypothetical protein